MRFKWEDFIRFFIACCVICFCVFEMSTCSSKTLETTNKKTTDLAAHGLRVNSLSGYVEPIR